MIEKATNDQQVRVIQKMITQLEKQAKIARGSEAKRRYQQKLKKYVRQLNELTMKPVQEEHDEEISVHSEASQSERYSTDFLTSPMCSPVPSLRLSISPDPTNRPNHKSLPFNVHSMVDENGTRIIKLDVSENPL